MTTADGGVGGVEVVTVGVDGDTGGESTNGDVAN